MKSILKISAFFALCAMLVIGLVACGDDNSDGNDPTLLVGTWGLTEIQGGPNEGTIGIGVLTAVIDETTYTVTTRTEDLSTVLCTETGTYTADSTAITTTTGMVTGTCGSSVGEVNVKQYTVNSTTLTTTGNGETMIWQRLL